MSTGEVNVYDTIFDKLDYETRDIIKRMFLPKSCSKIKIIPVQKQSGSKYCGLFAVAIATSLAYGEDPQDFTYDQDSLRTHLMDCFTKKDIHFLKVRDCDKIYSDWMYTLYTNCT